MIRPVKNLERYKYVISDIVFAYNPSEESIKIPSTLIKTFCIKHDFDKNVTPAYMLSMTVPKSYYELITTNMNTLTVTFSIYRQFIGIVTQSSVDSYNDIDNTIQNNLYASLTLKAINESSLSTITANRLHNDTIKNKETSDTVDYTQNLIPLDLYLYDYSKLSNYKINSSFVIEGGMNDLIYQLFKTRKFNNLLVDPLLHDKWTTYAIPYGHLGDNVKDLNELYGIYDDPYLLYMGPRRTYFLNKGNIGRCLEKGEMGYVNIYLEKLDDTGSIETGCICDEENKAYILSANTFNINDNDSTLDYVAGGEITTVIRGTGEIKKDTIGKYNIEKSYVVNNPKQHTQLIYAIKENKRNVVLNFENVDLNIFTPNKSFNIIPDSSFYSEDYNVSGKYRLTGSSILLKKQGDEEFKSSVQVTLNKVSE